jgi:hypothetical protein
VSDPRDPNQNPPGWTDPYSDPVDIGGIPPVAPGQPPTNPSGQPPGSPLLTGLIIGLLLIALSVAVFQLFGAEDDGTAAGTTTTTEGTSTTTTDGSSTTSSSTSTLPATDPYPPVDPPIPAEDIKMMTDGFRINDNDIKDIVFGTEADLAIGRLVASFGDPIDTGWQTSTGQYGVCASDLERVLIFDTLAAIVTKSGGQDIFNGYRNDLTSGGGLGTDPASIETLSGLAIGDTVETMQEIYASQRVVFGTDPKLGSIYEVNSAASGAQLLWGPVEGEDPSDRIVGIYAPDVCNR